MKLEAGMTTLKTEIVLNLSINEYAWNQFYNTTCFFFLKIN